MTRLLFVGASFGGFFWLLVRLASYIPEV